MSVKPAFTIEKLKNIATQHFYGHQDTHGKSASPAVAPARYRLVHVTGRRKLVDDRVLSDEDIKPAGKIGKSARESAKFEVFFRFFREIELDVGTKKAGFRTSGILYIGLSSLTFNLLGPICRIAFFLFF